MNTVNDIIIPNLALTVVQDTLKQYLSSIETEFEAEREQLVDFYLGQQLDKDSYLKEYFNLEVDKTKEKDFPHNLILTQLGLTSKIIDKKAKNYIQQPIRKIDGAVNEEYNTFLIDSGIKTTSKLIDRMTWLLGDNCVIINADSKTKKLQFFNPPYYIPLFDGYDNINPVAVLYSIGLISNAKGETVEGWAYWDDEKYIVFERPTWNLVRQVKNENGVFNAIFTHRVKPFRSHWTKDAQDLVGANRDINVILTSINNAFRYVGFPVWVATGVEPGRVGDTVGEQETVNPKTLIKIRFDKLVCLSSQLNDKPVSLAAVYPQVNWMDMMQSIKSRIDLIAMTWNVMIQWELTGTVSSGLALKIISLDDLNDRDEMQELYEEFFEQPLHEKLIEISKNISWFPTIPKGKLTLDWYESEYLESPQDKSIRLKNEIELNLTNPVDEIKKLNPDYDDRTALQKYLRNAKVNKLLKMGGGTIDDALDIILGKKDTEEFDAIVKELEEPELQSVTPGEEELIKEE